jgi:hypothetical protein
MPRLNASPECARLYGEVTGTAMTDPTLGRLHQLTVDAYAAQHPRDGGPPIATVFALVGLHLALDRDFSGLEVRGAHQRLAGDRRTWPALSAPAELAAVELTIFEIALADSAEGHLHALERWARAVWNAWRAEHDTVARMVSDVVGGRRGRGAGP